MIRAVALIAALTPSVGIAQSAAPCDWQASAQAIVEPWEENTRLFANGKVRIAALDTVEPAAGAAYLLVLSPPYTETGERQCRVIGFTNDMGFTALHFDALQSGYSPAKGLVFAVPVRVGVEGDSFTNGAILTVIVNQATGKITTDLALGRE